MLQNLERFLLLFRLRPFDTSTAGGRSKERLRRAALTTMASGGAKAISLLSSLISVPLTYRYLGPERYGIWMVLVSIISVMSFADMGIGNGLINAISEANGKDDRALAKQHITSAFVMLLCIAAFLAVAGVVSYSFVPWLRVFNVKSWQAAREGARATLVFYFWFVVSIPLGVITRAQAGLQQGYFPQVLGAFGSVTTLMALLVAIALHGSLPWLVFASTIGAVVATVFNGWLLFRDHPWLLPSWHAYCPESAKKILRLGMMFFFLQCAVAVGFTSDNIVIAQVLGAAAVAAYAVPQKLFSLVAMLVGMGIAPLWPAYGEALARGDVSWVRRVFVGSLWLAFGLSVALCATMMLAGRWILKVALGRTLDAPMSLLIALGAWGVISAVSGPIAILLNGAGAIKVQAIIAIIASSTNLTLSILLTRRFGVIGVCSGSIITQLLIVFPVSAYVIRCLLSRLANDKTKIDLQPVPLVAIAARDAAL